MDIIEPQKHISLKYFVGVSVAVLSGILIFGLRPLGFNYSNGVNWIKDQPGIRFSEYGIAYTNPFIELIGGEISKPDEFSVEIALNPASYNKEGFNFIMALHNGSDRHQLLMGQYRSWIILMNGDDYDHKRRTKRIVVNIASRLPTTRFVTVTTGEAGTEIYLDGKLVRTKKDLTLNIPDGSKTRLLMGNAPNGKRSWQGDIYGLAFYGYRFTAQDVARHFDRWAQARNFSFAKKDKPFVLYVFDDKKGQRALDHAGGNHHLEIPSRMQVLEKKIFSPAWPVFKFNRNFIQDIVVNFAGFIPFGFVLAATLIKLGGTFKKHDVFITVSFCFAVSLIIEILQAWIPSRSSDILDLMLNTLGALTGAIMYKFIFMRIYGKTRA